MKKAFKIHLPDYLTVDMFKQISTYDGNDIGKMINVISAMIGLPVSTVKQYPIDLIKQVSKDLEELALPKEQFHPLVEFNGQLYGYSDINSMNLGCFVDLEEYCKEHNDAIYTKVEDYPDGGHEVWAIPCDCAFPCATQNELTQIDAKNLIENG